MTTLSTPTPPASSGTSRVLAIAAGVLFTAGALAVLLEDILLKDAPFALKHGLTVIIVAGTMMVGHLGAEAWRSRHVLAVFGFGALFITGTALTVYTSAGRQAETSLLTAAEIEAKAEARARAQRGLREAGDMLTDSRARMARECATGKGKRCDGIAATVAVYEAAVKGHQADLERLGPAKPFAPEAEQLANIAAVFGADKARVKAAALLIVPFLTTLFLEFGAIVSFGYGFRQSRPATRNDPLHVAEPSDAELSELRSRFIEPNHPETPDSPKPGASAPLPANVVRLPDAGGRTFASRKVQVLRTIRTELDAGRTFPSQADLSRTFGVPRSTLSDWLGAWESEGAIPPRRTIGRCKAVG